MPLDINNNYPTYFFKNFDFKMVCGMFCGEAHEGASTGLRRAGNRGLILEWGDKPGGDEEGSWRA